MPMKKKKKKKKKKENFKAHLFSSGKLQARLKNFSSLLVSLRAYIENHYSKEQINKKELTDT